MSTLEKVSKIDGVQAVRRFEMGTMVRVILESSASTDVVSEVDDCFGCSGSLTTTQTGQAAINYPVIDIDDIETMP